jgi:hypothetical protein
MRARAHTTHIPCRSTRRTSRPLLRPGAALHHVALHHACAALHAPRGTTRERIMLRVACGVLRGTAPLGLRRNRTPTESTTADTDVGGALQISGNRHSDRHMSAVTVPQAVAVRIYDTATCGNRASRRSGMRARRAPAAVANLPSAGSPSEPALGASINAREGSGMTSPHCADPVCRRRAE